jgi:hypothetical protein
MSLLRRIATYRTLLVVIAIMLTLPNACGY